LRCNITTLRSENSYLTRENNDFRQRVALNDEQVRILVSSQVILSMLVPFLNYLLSLLHRIVDSIFEGQH
jgi:hypothetical protein